VLTLEGSEGGTLILMFDEASADNFGCYTAASRGQRSAFASFSVSTTDVTISSLTLKPAQDFLQGHFDHIIQRQCNYAAHHRHMAAEAWFVAVLSTWCRIRNEASAVRL